MVLENIDLVRSIVNRKFYNSNPELYEDMMQEGIIGLIKATRTFDESLGFKFSTYAYKIIRNEILIFLRQYKNKHYYLESLNEFIDESDGNELIDLVSTESPKEYIDLYNAMNKLKPIHKEVVYQVHFEEKTFQEIGDKNKMSKQNMHKRYIKAVSKLREYLGEDYKGVKNV